ncbi:hypothetical protein C9374_009414 [Naegleria lovaniensis]|uniref:EGF-like domain-containing protein n=1 Tax=Naegleria lovaniensis TaxID=51637 RepID=A0AA88KH65_NAELO|nr:uncharacterized protein C9374_009414 [Naegleria lovaniensis]KAG2377503.1 hypothetical protein C9374_009414 [Naegleria lovaniensis]
MMPTTTKVGALLLATLVLLLNVFLLNNHNSFVVLGSTDNLVQDSETQFPSSSIYRKTSTTTGSLSTEDLKTAHQLRDKRTSYYSVLEQDLKKQFRDFYDSKVKQKLVDTTDALDQASAILTELNINETVFATLTSAKEADLMASISTELELKKTLALTQFSAEKISENLLTLVNNYTSRTFGEEVFVRQFTSRYANDHHFRLNSRRGSFQLLERSHKNGIMRIRNRIAAGADHVLVLMPNGKLHSTGSYFEGNLGRSDHDSRLLYRLPVEALDGLEIYQFEVNTHSNLVLTNKGIYTFGVNNDFQLATGLISNVKIPTKMNGFGGKNITQIALGYDAGYAIDENGKLWAWGANHKGQLGDRTFDPKSRPFAVYFYGILKGKIVSRVCAGKNFAIALTTDNTLIAFGDNTFGQLGTNDTVSQGEPVKVKLRNLEGRKITDIQCGTKHNLLLTSDGLVFSWGSNENGQIGDNSTLDSLSPKFVSYLYNNLSCVAERIHTRGFVNFVVCSDKRLFSWGKNDIGQTGTGSIGSNILLPTLVRHSLQPIVDIATSEKSSFIFYADGSIFATGKCQNTRMFFNHDCIDSSPLYWNGRTFSERFLFNLDGYFTPISMQNDLHLAWYYRKPVYFEMGDLAYLLKQENTIPTRRNNGFNMYVMNHTENEEEWKIVEYDSHENLGFPDSIYNSHFLKHNEYFYLFGGFVNDEISDKIYRCPIFNLDKEWELLPFTLPTPVASGVLASSGDYAYIFGGITSMYSYNSTIDFSPRKNTVVTDKIMRAPLADLTSWEIVSDVLPVPIHSAFWEILDDYIYIFGGSRSFGTSQNNIFRASLKTPTIWEHTFSVLPYFMINTGQIASADGDIYLFGGTNSTSGVGGPYGVYAHKSDLMWNAIFDPNRTSNWCSKYPFMCYTCFGLEATNSQVCSSLGRCMDYDKCVCPTGIFGNNCEKTSIVAFNGIRRYADGTTAASCQEYKYPTNSSKLYEGISGSGLYMIQNDTGIPPVVVFCNMVTNPPSTANYTLFLDTTGFVMNMNESRSKYSTIQDPIRLQENNEGNGIYKISLPSSSPSAMICLTPRTGSEILCSYSGVCFIDVNGNTQCSCGNGYSVHDVNGIITCSR